MTTRRKSLFCIVSILIAVAVVAFHSSQYMPDAIALSVTTMIARLMVVFGAAIGIVILVSVFMRLRGRSIPNLNKFSLGSAVALVMSFATTLVSYSNDVPEGLLQLYLSS